MSLIARPTAKISPSNCTTTTASRSNLIPSPLSWHCSVGIPRTTHGQWSLINLILVTLSCLRSISARSGDAWPMSCTTTQSQKRTWCYRLHVSGSCCCTTHALFSYDCIAQQASKSEHQIFANAVSLPRHRTVVLAKAECAFRDVQWPRPPAASISSTKHHGY
jgi:hypothetical protein